MMIGHWMVIAAVQIRNSGKELDMKVTIYTDGAARGNPEEIGRAHV